MNNSFHVKSLSLRFYSDVCVLIVVLIVSTAREKAFSQGRNDAKRLEVMNSIVLSFLSVSIAIHC